MAPEEVIRIQKLAEQLEYRRGNLSISQNVMLLNHLFIIKKKTFFKSKKNISSMFIKTVWILKRDIYMTICLESS